MNNSSSIFILCVSLALLPALTHADSSTNNINPNLNPEEIARLAKKVEKEAAKHGAQVIIVGRVGRKVEDLPKGIKYTHVGIGVYSMIETKDGDKIPGYAMYNLYQDSNNQDKSYLSVDFPFDFFAGTQELRAGVIIPNPSLQKRILELIQSGAHEKLHIIHYSAIANPYTLRYQNCTEYILDIVNSAIYQTSDMEVLKQKSSAFFDAQKVNFSGIKLLLGSIFINGVTTTDHKNGIVTATYSTIGEYLEKYDLLQTQFEVSLR